MRKLRACPGVVKEDHIPNTEILSKLGESLLSEKIKKRRWGYLGHIIRYPESRWVRKMQGIQGQGKTKAGEGARATWAKEMEKERIRRRATFATARNKTRWAACAGRPLREDELSEGETQNEASQSTNLTIGQIERLKGRRRSCTVGKS